MPRMKIDGEMPAARVKENLAGELASELKSDCQYGQPFIYEQEYKTGKIRVTVVWDKWDGVPLQERSATIWRAYEMAESPAYRDRIALASGLTVPEAREAGMLPVEIIPGLRKTDPVTEEEVWQVMLDEGATRLAGPGRPRLWFATQREANAAKKRIIQKLPKSSDIWLLEWDFMPKEYGGAED